MSQDFRKRPDPKCRRCSGTGTHLYQDDGMVAVVACACTDAFPRDTLWHQLRRRWASFRYHLELVSRDPRDDEYPY